MFSVCSYSGGDDGAALSVMGKSPPREVGVNNANEEMSRLGKFGSGRRGRRQGTVRQLRQISLNEATQSVNEPRPRATPAAAKLS